MHIDIVQGNITDQVVDAIVNAANPSLLGGGGVDGAIHAAAGPQLLAECRRLRATTHSEGLASGLAVATGAGNLRARWVIHTAAPNRHVGQTNPKVLANCYMNNLYAANHLKATSLAFPALGAGACGWDPAEAADIAALAITRWFETYVHSTFIHRVTMVALQPEMETEFRRAFDTAPSESILVHGR